MTTAQLPPGPSTPRIVQVVSSLTRSRRGLPRLRERYGDAFTIDLLGFGRTVVISNAAEIKQLFQAGPELVDTMDLNLGRILGSGSLFALEGAEHRRRRALLVPPFHGRRLAAYERIVEEETVRELVSWPQDRPFATLPSMMRITLNTILRAVFGAEGAEFDQLRAILPRLVTLGSVLAAVPLPTADLGGWGPWGRFRVLRRRYDAVVARLVDVAARADDLDERDDVLAMLLQSRYEDGSRMSRGDIADQLLALLAAGHETTATTLAWAVERLRRHPEVLRGLVEEVDAGGVALRQATIYEVQRNRPAVDLIGRQVKADFPLGRWMLPRGTTVVVGIALLHDDETVFPDARAFDPTRFLGTRPDLYQWIPFGGGPRRCVGAAFANMEMDVALRTMLRDVTLLPTGEPGERWHSRGVANAPGRGGRAVVRRRASVRGAVSPWRG